MSEEESLLFSSVDKRGYTSCRFQRPCWKNIRAPKARKYKIYLPYICSYQQEGDLEKCGIRDDFISNETKGVAE